MANIEDFQALEPFFPVIERGLDGPVDGEHFFDLLADDIITEFVVTVPGYPRRVDGRAALAELYRDYGDTMRLERTSDVFVHHDREASVVVLEYAVHGQVVQTGRRYTNHFVSVITLVDRRVTRWRDYLDSYAVLQAVQDDLPRCDSAEPAR